jgi:predicted O-methyltransferase YrrM
MERRFIPDYILDYCAANSSYFDTDTAAIYEKSMLLVNSHMLIGQILGMLVHIIVLAVKPKRVFELGSFTGFTSSLIATALTEGAVLISSEENKNHYDLAAKNLQGYIRSGKVQLFHCDGMKLLSDSSFGTFDIIFIDARKESFCDKIGIIYSSLNTNGLLFVDNSLAGLAVFSPKKSWEILTKQFNETIKKDKRFKVVQMPIRDGLTLAIKI